VSYLYFQFQNENRAFSELVSVCQEKNHLLCQKGWYFKVRYFTQCSGYTESCGTKTVTLHKVLYHLKCHYWRILNAEIKALIYLYLKCHYWRILNAAIKASIYLTLFHRN